MSAFKICLNSGTHNPIDATTCSVCGYNKFKIVEKVDEEDEETPLGTINCWNCPASFSPENLTCPECGVPKNRGTKIILLPNTKDGQVPSSAKYKNK